MSDPVPTVATQPSRQGTLSPDRAFVVHFYATEAGEDIESGRAEHIRSGTTTHFRAWSELAAFVAATLESQAR